MIWRIYGCILAYFTYNDFFFKHQNQVKDVSREVTTLKEWILLSETLVILMTTAPRGGYGNSYSGEVRLFVRGLARESGWLALTGPREGRAGVTATLLSLDGLTPAGESYWPFATSDLYSISVLNSSSVA